MDRVSALLLLSCLSEEKTAPARTTNHLLEEPKIRSDSLNEEGGSSGAGLLLFPLPLFGLVFLLLYLILSCGPTLVTP